MKINWTFMLVRHFLPRIETLWAMVHYGTSHLAFQTSFPWAICRRNTRWHM